MHRYCLYIDESGVPELTANTDYCLMTGVLFNKSDERSFSFLTERIKKKYNLDFDKHIHAVDIFEKQRQKCYLGKTKKRTRKDLRIDFQRDMWDLIKDFSVNHHTVAVPKKTVKKVLGLLKQSDQGQKWIRSSNFYARVDRQLPMDIGVNALYEWALKKIKNEDSLEVIFESRSGDEFTVRNYGYIRNAGVFKNKRMGTFAKKLRDQVVSLAFANKGVKLSGLELADLISYTNNVYYLQIKKRAIPVENSLKKAICFKGIHKTLNNKHYIDLNERAVRKYFPGLNSRTKRIAEYYSSHSLSPASAGAQLD